MPDEYGDPYEIMKLHFPVGLIVVPSDLAIREGRWPRERRWGRLVFGKVVGYDGSAIKVLVDGSKQPQAWHSDFWVRSSVQALAGRKK